MGYTERKLSKIDFSRTIVIKNKELGYDYKNIVYTPIYFSWRYKTETIRELLLKDPNIISASAVSDLPINLTFKRLLTDWDSKTTEGDIYVYLMFTDIGFIETFNSQLIEGAFFSKDFTLHNYIYEQADQYYVVNEEAVKQMELKDPIYKKFNLNGFSGEIIGVVKDFHFRPLQKKIEPLFIQFNPENWLYLFIKLKEIDRSTLNYIKSSIEKFENKGYPVEFKFLEDDFNNLYRPVRRIAYATIVFAVTAFILSIIGLIAIISFLEQKKQKQFAIKKVFGAQSYRIIKDFVIELSWYLVPSLLIAAIIGYYGTKEWLQTFVYQPSYPYLQLALAIAFIYILIVILVYFKVRKTTNLNPSETLKYE